MEVKHHLLNFKNMVIYQNTDYFTMSLDSLLLANFVTINLRDKMIIDLATGNAPIPLLLSKRTKAKIYGIEIQEEIYNLAKKSVKENKLDDQITLLLENVKNVDSIFKSDFFDIITCNPPYFKVNTNSNLNKNKVKTIARHEIELDLDSILKISKKLLKTGGKLAIVHRPERLTEILEKFRYYNIEPKKIRFVYPKLGKDSNIMLVEGIKNGQSGIKIMQPLIIYDDNNNYTDEVKKMFGE